MERMNERETKMSQYLRKSLAVLAVGLVSMSLTYCGKKPNVGTVSVMMTASSGSFDSVSMTISKIEFLEGNTDAGTWRTLSQKTQTVELSSLNGGTRTLLDKVQVPAGSYKKIRITLADGSVVPAQAAETSARTEEEPAAEPAPAEGVTAATGETAESEPAATEEAAPASLPGSNEDNSVALRSRDSSGGPMTMGIDHEFKIARHRHYELVLKVDAASSISRTRGGSYVLGNSVGISRFSEAP